jgi:putative ABC transport system ATP-binding protein
MIIQTEDLMKIYGSGFTQITALNRLNLKIEKGEFVAIMGASGSGKSTLLNVLGCLDGITSGKYYLDDVDVSSLGENELASIRNKKIGFVFQAYNLLPKLSAFENVMLPMLYANVPSRVGQGVAKAALKKVGLEDRMNHKPKELSGGQSQRVAIARALVNNPSIILADEPTGNLDSKAGKEIMYIFQKLNDEGTTIMMVTHDGDIATHSKRIISFKDGCIQSDAPVKKRIIDDIL